MMSITKHYKEKDLGTFILYSNGLNNETSVFYEYYTLVSSCKDLPAEDVLNTILDYKKVSKSNLRISKESNGLGFYRPNKYVFPVFYIIFK